MKPGRNGSWPTALVVISLVWLVACGPAPEKPDNVAAPTESRMERLARVIQEYDAQGVHRTGSAVDGESARWLATLVEHTGFEPRLEALPFERIDPVHAYLEVAAADGSVRRYEGEPLIDSAEYTDSDGISGSLGDAESDAEIVVTRLPPTVQYQPFFHQLRTSDRHRALVVVTGGSDFDLPADSPRSRSSAPGYALINADRYLQPYGHPVLQLPSEVGPELVEARERGAQARLVLSIERATLDVYNVTVTVPGRDPEASPIVVMTPRSGWWEVASERGGGIALWVELLHALRASPPRRSVHFVASTGHELGHVGLHRYLEQRHELIGAAHLWLHLGANFAAAEGGSIRLQASTDALMDRAIAAMREQGVAPGVTTPVADRPFGEAREIFDGGGRFLSLLGSNGLFHSPADRWPDAVDLELLAKVADAFVALTLELASEA